MRVPSLLLAVFVPVLAASCAAPGPAVSIQPGDFALIEIQLQG